MTTARSIRDELKTLGDEMCKAMGQLRSGRNGAQCSSLLGKMQADPLMAEIASEAQISANALMTILRIEEGAFDDEYWSSVLFSTYVEMVDSGAQITFELVFRRLLQNVRRSNDPAYAQIVRYLASTAVLSGGQRISLGVGPEVIVEEFLHLDDEGVELFKLLLRFVKAKKRASTDVGNFVRRVLRIPSVFKDKDNEIVPSCRVLERRRTGPEWPLPDEVLVAPSPTSTFYALWFDEPTLLRRRAVRALCPEDFEKAREGLASLRDLGPEDVVVLGSDLRLVNGIVQDLVGVSAFRRMKREDKQQEVRSRGRPSDEYRLRKSSEWGRVTNIAPHPRIDVPKPLVEFDPTSSDLKITLPDEKTLKRYINEAVKRTSDKHIASTATLVKIALHLAEKGPMNTDRAVSGLGLTEKSLEKYVGGYKDLLSLGYKRDRMWVSLKLPFLQAIGGGSIHASGPQSA